LQTFASWIKLALPEEILANLANDNPNLMELVFEELQSDQDENLEAATEIVIELVKLGRGKEKFKAI
jgi:hypothetical protein